MTLNLMNRLFAMFCEYGIRFDVPQANRYLLYYVMIPIIAILVLWTYRRNATTIANKYWSGAISFLRIMFYLILAVYCFSPMFTRYVNNSRVLLMIDTSDSMSINDSNGISRMDHIRRVISNSKMIETLENSHDIAFHTFGQSEKQIEKLESTLQWLNQIQPNESETALCDAVTNVIKKERGNPLAAIYLITDGCNNKGMTEDEMFSSMKQPMPVIHTMGVGKTTAPFRLRIRKEEFPKKMIVHGKYSFTLEIVAEGTMPIMKQDQSQWNLDLYMIPRAQTDTHAMPASWTEPIEQKPINTKKITWSYKDRILACEKQKGSTLSIPIVLSPEEKGKYYFVARLHENINDETIVTTINSDTVRETEVVERKEKLLAFAGETNRDFQFFQSRMKRRNDLSVDYFNPDKADLNSEMLSQYDVIVAMDPDWKKDFTREEILALERWVARDSGGLILTAGRLRAGQQMNSWIETADISALLNLYPVRFFSNDTMIHHEMTSYEKPVPAAMTPKGMELPIATLFANNGKYDTGSDNTKETNHRFEGFYTCLFVKEVKPTANLYATLSLSNSRQKTNNTTGQAVLYAEQRYGSGRVFYMGNTETWRLRNGEETAFDRFWIMLTRYIGQERFNRQSPFGRLWTDRDEYRPGDTVRIEAEMHDRQLQPLRVDQVEVTVTVDKTGTTATKEKSHVKEEKQKIVLTPQPKSEGLYEGKLQVGTVGEYSLDTDIPVIQEKLTDSFAVRHGELESPPSLQNVTLLKNMAQKTGGQYYDLNDPETERYLTELANTISPWSRELETDNERQRIFQTVVLALLCLLPLVEWTLRRWMRIL